MDWAGISTGGKTDLVMVNGYLTSQRYVGEILRPLVVPYAGNYFIQDDNTGPHRGLIVQDFIEEQGKSRMNWPAVSPDLNPIEDMLGILGRRNPDSTANDPRVILIEEWIQITQKEVDRLIASIRRRYTECTEAGGHTHY